LFTTSIVMPIFKVLFWSCYVKGMSICQWQCQNLPWLCEGELEKCSKFIVKDYNMDKKNWEGKARVDKVLCYCRFISKNVLNFYESTICFTHHLVSRKLLNIKMQFPYVMDVSKFCICLLECQCGKLGLLFKPLLTHCSLLASYVFWIKVKVIDCYQMHFFKLSHYALPWKLMWLGFRFWINH